MTHAALTEIDALLGGIGGALPTAEQTNRIVRSLSADSSDYLYNSLVSLLECIHGIRIGRYSWGAVKGYYSAFYAMRAHLARHSVCIGYNPSDHHYYSLQLSTIPKRKKLKTSTHTSVLIAYRDHPSTKSIVQEINGVPAPSWLKELRENAHYSNSKFSDPQPLPHQLAEKVNVLRNVEAYVKDIDTYCYDPDHAAIAFPIKLIGAAVSTGARLNLTEAEKAHLQELVQDASEICQRFFLPIAA
ncbi:MULTISPECIES: hypothetical protein [Burkholderia]|uniref:hypothetical protein n=1 Tax=Burkholderia TaxID=32008 RepID=UPI0012D2F9BA|nr:hypothetical protein [Burkholderia glumae]